MTLSVSQLLNDNDSVISMDLNLSSIQSLIESIAYRTNADVALVLTKQGLVVAHSDKGEVGSDYSEPGNDLNKHLYLSLK